MATQVWPTVTVPNHPLYGSYSETPVPQQAEFQPDIGEPSRTPRAGFILLEVAWRIFLDDVQKDALREFWRSTCKQGARRFTLADPITGVTHTWSWVQAPVFNAVGTKEQFNADIRLRRMEDM
jgi:hypothetical protein